MSGEGKGEGEPAAAAAGAAGAAEAGAGAAKKKRPRVLILGAGFGGLSAAAQLDAYLETHKRAAEVIIMERRSIQTLETSNQFAMLGRGKPNQFSHSYSELRLKNVLFVQDEVHTIDTAKRVVVAKGHRFKYDHLVLSLGTLPDPERVPGLAQAAYDIASFDSVVQLKDALSDFGGGTVLVAIPQGATHDSAWAYGYALMAHALLAKDEAVMRKTKIKVVTAEKAVAPADSSEQLARLLSQRGIELRTKTRLTFVDPVKRFAVLQDGTKVPFDLLIAQFPRRPLPMLTECKLADRGGYVQSDSRTCKTRFANVYCIGECADMRMPYSNATPFPKSGAFAINQGVVVAEDIIQRLSEAGQGWVVDEGVKQSNSCVVAVETGNSEAVKITWDLFSDPYSGTTKVSPPGRENLKFLVSWWEELLLNWFRPHEPEPDKKKK